MGRTEIEKYKELKIAPVAFIKSNMFALVVKGQSKASMKIPAKVQKITYHADLFLDKYKDYGVVGNQEIENFSIPVLIEIFEHFPPD